MANKIKIETNKDATKSTIGLSGLVFIVFLVLKLAEIGQVANWSWWWVISPLWLPLLAFIAIVLVAFVILGIIWGIATIIDK